MSAPLNNSNETTTTPQEAEQQPPSVVPPTQQQPVKTPVDTSSIDATIQGLLVQVIALQHNKIQQLNPS